jgi:hypothetical protein
MLRADRNLSDGLDQIHSFNASRRKEQERCQSTPVMTDGREWEK